MINVEVEDLWISEIIDFMAVSPIGLHFPFHFSVSPKEKGQEKSARMRETIATAVCLFGNPGVFYLMPAEAHDSERWNAERKHNSENKS